MEKKTVMAFGTFDVFHKGHEHYLKEAKSYGDKLIVVVGRDKNIQKFKQQAARHNENARLHIVKGKEYVDDAILGNEDDIYAVLEQIKPNVIVLGYDQKTVDEDQLALQLKERHLKATIKRAKAFEPEKYKSSLL